jgi:hypothetical protein
MKRLFSVILFIGVSLSCEKQTDLNRNYAEVTGFNPDKCMCCWGWTIKVGNDTIKSDNAIIGQEIGFEIGNPVPVIIELGEKDDRCSSYYEIIRIERIN